MTPPYLVTPTAANHIDAIWRYIALDNLEAANRVEETIYEALRFLDRIRCLGHAQGARAEGGAILAGDTVSELHRCLCS